MNSDQRPHLNNLSISCIIICFSLFLSSACTTGNTPETTYEQLIQGHGFVLKDAVSRRTHWEDDQSPNMALVELGILASAPVNIQNGSTPMLLELSEEDEGKNILRKHWSITNRYELLRSIDNRVHSGLRKLYRESLRSLNEAKHRDYISPELSYFLNHAESLSIDVVISYELGRISSLARWGFGAGYLTRQEAEYILEDVGLMVRELKYDFNFQAHSQIMGISQLYRKSPNMNAAMRNRALFCYELLDQDAWSNKNWKRLLKESKSKSNKTDIDLPSYFQEIKILPELNRSNILTRKERKLFNPSFRPKSIIENFSHENDLYNAITDNDYEAVQKVLIISNKRGLTFIDTPVRGHLSWASLSVGNTEILKLLVENGFSLHVNHPVSNATVLHDTMWAESEESALYLIGQGLDGNHQDMYGVTPLHVAAESGMVKVVKELISKGADPTIRSNSGFTPLLYYLNSEYNRVYDELGVDQSVYDFDGLFAPHLQQMNSVLPANRGIANNDGQYPLWYLRLFGDERQLYDEIKFMKENYTDFQIREDRGYEILNSLLKRDQRTAFKQAISITPNLNYINNDGYHILSTAAYSGHYHWAAVSLVQGGADPDLPFGRKGENILDTKIEYSNFYLIADLVENGASVNYLSEKWGIPFFTKFLQEVSVSKRPLDRLEELCTRMVKAGALLLPFPSDLQDSPLNVLKHEKFDTFRDELIELAVENGERINIDF